MQFDTIKIDDQDFGNTWTTSLRFPNNTEKVIRGERPKQFDGVHGLVKKDDLFHLMSEDDGHFWTSFILTENELKSLHRHLSNLVKHFHYTNNYKVKVKPNLVTHQTIKDIEGEIDIIPRNDSAPLINLKIKDNNIQFDVNWLPSLIKVTDIDNPIKI
jgi:hypothetical protein